jgi:hypothetical protein
MDLLLAPVPEAAAEASEAEEYVSAQLNLDNKY